MAAGAGGRGVEIALLTLGLKVSKLRWPPSHPTTSDIISHTRSSRASH